MRNIFFLFCLIILMLLQSACRVVQVSPESLHAQLSKINESTVKEAYNFDMGLLVGFISGKQFNNGLKKIECTDNKGKNVYVKVNGRTRIRLVYTSGKKRILLFDTMFVKDGKIYGKQSRVAGLPIDPVDIKDIVKAQLLKPELEPNETSD